MLFDPGGRTTASSRASAVSGAIAIVAGAGDDAEFDWQPEATGFVQDPAAGARSLARREHAQFGHLLPEGARRTWCRHACNPYFSRRHRCHGDGSGFWPDVGPALRV